MIQLPQELIKAWDERDGAIVFTTTDADGTPNSIYATCVGLYEEEMIVIANNYFDKTMKNIQNGSRASVLFITKDGKAYQIKGQVGYHMRGPVYDFMKKWNPEKHPGHGAAALIPEAVYSGSEKLS
ncbi:MAG: pyridoxamine 5'-phosphate oxidase family protein [Spirochaetales bacterium]|nr:pyridoxamine 5'-phosphate oxidase family protein [Spirochaetales bacterium]